ncbi:MAG: YcgL domain-containing protein [Gammaproteobacteria bacterium]
MNGGPARCVVYRSTRKADTYLYIDREDDFTRVPEPLRVMLGALERVMTLELAPGRRLARADVETVRRRLAEDGYYLQVPPAVF